MFTDFDCRNDQNLKIWQNIHLLILDQYVSRWGGLNNILWGPLVSADVMCVTEKGGGLANLFDQQQ